jgi:poly-gamma-glutamate capsule biosynthesis protein CapA/YwtB (metallophosphatase superfamily)
VRRRAIALALAAVGLASSALGDADVEGPSDGEVRIGASGDLLAHLRVLESAEAHRARGGFVDVLRALKRTVRPREWAFLNLETPLSVRVPPVTGSPPVLGAPAEVAEALALVGIDAVSAANNHAYDQTAAGMVDTLAALEAAGVRALGAVWAGEDPLAPVVLHRPGELSTAWVTVTERINRGPAERPSPTRVARADEATTIAALERARGLADVVVLSIHWSTDFVERPSAARRAQARRFVEAGADVILAHGPHVLQPVERLPSPRGEAVVAYSLGNAVSNQGLHWRPERRWYAEEAHPAGVLPTTRDGVWLRVGVRRRGGRLAVHQLEAVPLHTRNTRGPTRISLRLLDAVEPAIRAARRPAIEAALGSAVRLVPPRSGSRDSGG